MRQFRFVVPAALLFALGSASAQAEKPAPAEMVAVGEAKDCVFTQHIRNTRVHDDQTIDFIMLNGDIYRNTLPYRCSRLGFEEAFSYKSSTSQLCSVDIISVLDRTGGGLSRGASCGLGKFQKMTKVSK